MTVLPEEYLNSVCEIKNLRNDLLAPGRIFSIATDSIEFVHPDDDRMPLLPYNTPVKVSVFNNQMGFKILGGSIFISTDKFLRIADIVPIQEFERRGYFRMNVKHVTKIYPIDPHNDEISPTPVEVMLEDVSLSGVRISSLSRMPMGDQFAIQLQLLKKKMLFYCRVMRNSPSNDNRNHYGCAFFNQSDKQTDDLCYDLFQLQRLEIRKRRKAE